MNADASPHPGMLVLDLDGTALRSDSSIDPADRAAVDALRELGVVVTIATGRIFSGTRDIAAGFGITGLVACANGSELLEAPTGRVHAGYYLTALDRRFVRNVYEAHGLSGALLTTAEVHHDAAALDQRRFLESWSSRLVGYSDRIASAVWEGAPAANAVVGLGDGAQSQGAYEELLRSRPDLETIFVRDYDGERSFIKTRRSDVDKGTALRTLAERHGVPVERTVAVGDWHNDTPMLKVAGRAFAARGAPPEVSAAAQRLDTVRGAGGIVAEVARRAWGVRA
ncbi:MAG: HAD family hydrolase [Myxococcota bacterium]